jgi:general secretion pathway protein H
MTAPIKKSRNGEYGFTLAEVIVVLLIISLGAAVGFSAFRRTAHDSPLTVAQNIQLLAQSTRVRAITSGKVQSIAFDLANRKISGAKGPPITLGPDVQLAITSASEKVENPKNGLIEFYPDGSSSGAKIGVRTDRMPIVVVNVPWLTGIAQIDEQ